MGIALFVQSAILFGIAFGAAFIGDVTGLPLFYGVAGGAVVASLTQMLGGLNAHYKGDGYRLNIDPARNTLHHAWCQHAIRRKADKAVGGWRWFETADRADAHLGRRVHRCADCFGPTP